MIKKQDLIIFGGSPFVNTIDLSRINTNHFDILCINRPILNVPVHYLIAYDDDFRACHNQQEVKSILAQHLNPVLIAPKTEFIHKSTGWQFKRGGDYINHNKQNKIVGFWLYTCSSAVNFAYLREYKNVYLVGIDLKEDNQPFNHWHGIKNIKEVPVHCAKMAKEYIYLYKKYINIYQCNPEVKDIWDIPYCPIDRLYNHQ